MKRVGVLLTVLAALALLPALAPADAAAVSLREIGHFNEPMYVTSPPEEPGRLFVAERSGLIQQVQRGAVTQFADLRSVVSCCANDLGLQSIAIAPDFATTGRFYVDYTDRGGDIQIAEMKANGRAASLSTLRGVITVPYDSAANHYGGTVAFGPEGDLFISTGDGGHGNENDEHHNGQRLNTLLGKLLRIDPTPSGALPYTVPADNPYASSAAPYNTIWSTGLRNPFRFSFDFESDVIAIADVGEGHEEEVDILPVPQSRGANFGWSCREGLVAGPESDPECATPPPGGYVNPVFVYGHKQLEVGAYGCAIIGGYISRDPGLPELFGRYVYTDFCVPEIRSFSPSDPAGTDHTLGVHLAEPTSLGADSCGRLYVVSKAGPVDELVGEGGPTVCGGRASAHVSLKARKRLVNQGAKISLEAVVTPCRERAGERVVLYRSGKAAGGKRLNKECRARIPVRVGSDRTYRAKVGADEVFASSISKPVKLRVRQPATKQAPKQAKSKG